MKNRLLVGCLASTCAVVPLASGHVNLLSPDGGEVFQVGSTVTIEWEVAIQHGQLNWDLWYSTTGLAGPWIEMAVDLPAGPWGAGSVHTFEWTVPDAVSDQVRVQVRMDNDGTDYYDNSMSDLSIVASCIADFDNDGFVNTGDLLQFLNAWNAGDSAADLNSDGVFNTSDVIAYLNRYVVGCP